MTEPVNKPKFLHSPTKLFYLLIVVMIIFGIIIFRSISGESQTATKKDWKLYSFEPLGLDLMVPPELIVHTEEPNPGDFTAYIQNYPFNDPYPKENAYQLYIIWQKNYTLTRDEFNQLKNDLVWYSVEHTTIDGFPAIKGQIQGERSRFVIYIYKDKRLISLLIANTTESNKKLSDKILSTFTFQP